MPVTIHYGVPGTYKTSGTIHDELPKAVSAGRVLITNIRGLDNAEKIKSIFRKHKKKVSDDFEIIWLDNKKEDHREKLRNFFHWAPQDAFFIIDEINTIYPTEWRKQKLDTFNLHDGTDLLNTKYHLTTRDGVTAFDTHGEPIIRPQNLYEALEQHRHFNWDFICTSPSYKKFNAVFHEVAEMAYKHINRATIGLRGYWEISHMADNRGTSKQDIILEESKKIPKWVFSCYESTATGETRDSQAGKNIFLQMKFIPMVIIFILALWYAITSINESVSDKEEITNEVVTNGIKSTEELSKKVTSSKGIASSASTDPRVSRLKKIPHFNNSVAPSIDVLQGYKIFLSGVLFEERYIKLVNSDGFKMTNVKTLEKFGYTFDVINTCMVVLGNSTNDQKILLSCEPRKIENKQRSLASNINPFSEAKTAEN